MAATMDSRPKMTSHISPSRRPSFLRLDSSGENKTEFIDSPEIVSDHLKGVLTSHNTTHSDSASNTSVNCRAQSLISAFTTGCKSSFSSAHFDFKGINLFSNQAPRYPPSARQNLCTNRLPPDVMASSNSWPCFQSYNQKPQFSPCKSASKELEILNAKFGGMNNNDISQQNMDQTQRQFQGAHSRVCSFRNIERNRQPHQVNFWREGVFHTYRNTSRNFPNQRMVNRTFPDYYQQFNPHQYMQNHVFPPYHMQRNVSFRDFGPGVSDLSHHVYFNHHHGNQGSHSAFGEHVFRQNQRSRYRSQHDQNFCQQQWTRRKPFEPKRTYPKLKKPPRPKTFCQASSSSPFRSDTCGSIKLLLRKDSSLEVPTMNESSQITGTSNANEVNVPLSEGISVHQTVPSTSSTKETYSDLLNERTEMYVPFLYTGTNNSTEDKSGIQNTNSQDDHSVKQRHSSIDYLLQDLSKNLEISSDSDFVDTDWDTVEGNCQHDDSWDEIVEFTDPYDPLNGWRCKNKYVQEDSLSDETDLPHQCGKSALLVLDSGTESGSENSDDESDVSSDCERDLEGREVNESLSISATEEDISIHEQKDNKDGGNQIESSVDNENRDNLPQTEALPSRHPSLNFILGSVESDDDEDDGTDSSDDWDSFDDSDDDDIEEKHSEEKSNQELLWKSLFKTNDRFHPLLSWQCKDGSKLVTSPKPATPIHSQVVFRTASVTITHRIMSLESDSPVSVTVPLSPEGKLQRSPTTEEKHFIPPKHQSPHKGNIQSCLKSMKWNSPTVKRKVTFHSSAMLIICPEPVHLSEDIRATRKGPWIDFARERCHFQRRIRDIELSVSPYLHPDHRQKVYDERFKCEGS